MDKNRWSFALLAVPMFLACVLVIGAERSHVASARSTAAPAADPTCSSSNPCVIYANTGTGPGIRGTSTNGNGLAGATSNISTSPSKGREGVIGNDISTSGVYNAGVRGLSTNGQGVAGQSTGGEGVLGTSTSNVGVEGTSSSNLGVYGASTSYDGVVGQTYGAAAIDAGIQGTNNSLTIAVRANGLGGLLFDGNNSIGNDVFTVDDSGNTGTSGQLSSAQVAAVESSGQLYAIYGKNDVGGNRAGDFEGAYIGVLARAPAGTGNYPLDLTTSAGTPVFYVDGDGDVYYTGTLNSVALTRSGETAIAYGARATSPTVEDTGSGQMINGVAMVELDPAFVQTIDPRVTYHVMLTPDGDTRGLFVASKGPTGFVVREVQGGRNSLAFDYHIYATALGHPNERMAVVTRSFAATFMPKAPLAIVTRPALRHVPKALKPHISS